MAEGERPDDEESGNGEDGEENADGEDREQSGGDESGSGSGADVDTDEAGARAAEESGDDGDDKRSGQRRERELEQEGESEGKAERAPDEERDRDDEDRDEDEEEDRGPGPVKLILLALATLLFVFLGLLVFVKGLAPGWKSAIVLGLVWLLIAGALIGRFLRNRAHLRAPVLGAFAVIAAAFVIFVIATHLGGKTAKEKVVTGTRLSQAEGSTRVPRRADEPPPPQNIELLSGKFEGMKEGSASGEAKIVKLPDNKLKLTITDLDVAAGPGQHVYLATGSGVDIKHALKVGKLKGTKGDQQYDIPEQTDTDSLTTVVIYGTTFGVPYGRAKMKQQ